MRILCTFPGRHGDLLWALPTIRALSRRLDAPVDLLISGKYGSLAPLLRQQAYLGVVIVDSKWEVQETAPMTPREPPHAELWREHYDVVFHLAYRGWPERALPFETLDCLNAQAGTDGLWWPRILDSELALEEPWITVEPWPQAHPVVLGWSDEHVELKYGLTRLLELSVCGASTGFVLCAPGSRWETEADFEPTDWLENARRLTACDVFVGCCSALHVLAIATGRRCVIMEPNRDRHHPIFWPLGQTGRVQLVRGNDGQPTFDHRHLRDAIDAALQVTA